MTVNTERLGDSNCNLNTTSKTQWYLWFYVKDRTTQMNELTAVLILQFMRHFKLNWFRYKIISVAKIYHG